MGSDTDNLSLDRAHAPAFNIFMLIESGTDKETKHDTSFKQVSS